MNLIKTAVGIGVLGLGVHLLNVGTEPQTVYSTLAQQTRPAALQVATTPSPTLESMLAASPTATAATMPAGQHYIK